MQPQVVLEKRSLLISPEKLFAETIIAHFPCFEILILKIQKSKEKDNNYEMHDVNSIELIRVCIFHFSSRATLRENTSVIAFSAKKLT